LRGLSKVILAQVVGTLMVTQVIAKSAAYEACVKRCEERNAEYCRNHQKADCDGKVGRCEAEENCWVYD
jgi:hypothetical protein